MKNDVKNNSNLNTLLPSSTETAFYEPLRFLLTSLETSETDYEYFSNLCLYIISYLQNAEVLRPLRIQWMEEARKYRSTVRTTQESALQEAKNVYREIADACVARKVQNDSDIKKALKVIEDDAPGCLETSPVKKPLDDKLEYLDLVRSGDFADILGDTQVTSNYRFFLPQPHALLYDRLHALCELLLSRGHGDLVSKYAKVRSRKSVKTANVDSGASQKEEYIQHFTFSPSIVKLQELQETLSCNRLQYPWAIWDNLNAAKWAWDTNPSFFYENQLLDDARKNRKNRMTSRTSYCFWNEVQQFESRFVRSSERVFFRRRLFKQYLRSIINSVVYFLATDAGCARSEEQFFEPCAYHLFLDHDELWMIVEWPDQEQEEFLIKKCQSGQEPLRFLSRMMQSKAGSLVSTTDGSAASKQLDRIFGKGLAEIFTRSNETTKTHFLGTSVEVCKLHGVDHTCIINELRRLHELYGSDTFPTDQYDPEKPYLLSQDNLCSR